MRDGDGIWTPGAGIPSLLFRFCAHATLGIYSNHAGKVWEYIEGHTIPQIPPYSPNVMRSAQIAEKWSRIGFYWNFALWIPTAIFPNILVFAAGVFDLFLAVQIAISTALQDPWLPQKKSQCAAVADTWQTPDNGTASIFTLIGSFNETSIPATDVCVTFLNSWNHGIASLVLYALIAVFNVGGAILIFVLANTGDRRRLNNHTRDKRWPQILLGAVAFIPHLVFKFLLIGFDLLVSILPYKIANYVRMPVRYASKAIQALIFPIWRSRRILYSVPKKIRRRVVKYKQGTDIDMTTIQNGRFLRILHFDTLSLISQHLHYTDMINLSLTSKAVRDLTFPASDVSNRRKLYAKYTCDEITKENCFVCKRQICQPCTTRRDFGTRLTRTLHGERCEARCTKCFMGTFVKRMIIDYCTCTTSFNQMSESGNPKSLCDLCALESVRYNVKRYGKWETLHLTAENKEVTQCSYCNSAFPWWSPKWWVCRFCQKDCWGSIHPPW